LSLGGSLETLDLPALLQTLAVGQASGRLVLTRLDRHAVLVLKRGRVVHAGGGTADATLSARLIRQGLVGEKDLLQALERQHDGSGYRKLGDVLVEMGVLAEGTLQAVIQQHMQELVAGLLGWKSGYFRFDSFASSDDKLVEEGLGDYVLRGGLDPKELLMRAVTALDRGELTPPPPAVVAPPPKAPPEPIAGGPSLTGSYVADFTGEAVLSLLRFASQIVSRAVVYAVDGEVARSVGEFGARPSGRPGEVAETVLSLREPSVLRVAQERRRTYIGPLEPTHVNLRLLEAIGGGKPPEALAMPLVVQGEVGFILYGDNAPSGRALGPVDALESAAARAARIIEKTLAARKSRSPRSS
jgi:hypothetical protein